MLNLQCIAKMLIWLKELHSQHISALQKPVQICSYTNLFLLSTSCAEKKYWPCLFSNPKLWILNRLMLKPCFEKNFPPNQFHWFHCGWCAGPSVRWSTNWAAGGAHRRVGHYQLVLESRPVFYYRHPLSPFHQLLLSTFQWYWSTANWSTGRQTHRAVNEYNPEFVHMVHTLHCDLPHVNCGKKCQTKLPWPPTIHSEPPTTFTFTFRNGWGTICTQNDGIARIGFVDKSSNKILAMPAFWVHMVPQPLP